MVEKASPKLISDYEFGGDRLHGATAQWSPAHLAGPSHV